MLSPGRLAAGMRVVGGVARGRRLRAPPGNAVRPTSDMVREAIFDMLASLDAVETAEVLDLFAGTGALGIEALSRGAARCTFVESDRAALAAVEANLAATGLADRARLVRADAMVWLRHAPPVDLALCDPPYSFGDWEALLFEVCELPSRLVVAEAGSPVTAPAGWGVLKARRYGGTVVTLLSPLLPA